MRGDAKISILVIYIFILLGPSEAVANITSHDAAVLSEIVKALGPPEWSSENACNWAGIDCDSSGHVTGINLHGKGLYGEIPTEITLLPRLKNISLQSNYFSGQFPPLADLPYLMHVFLDDNNFTSVPSNFLKGLTNLQILSIGENRNLAPWTFPASLADSTFLKNISIESANLFGKIPDIFGSLTNLQSLRLTGNNLTGPLPPSLENSGIKNLWINKQDQGLSGSIEVLGKMPELIQVWLHGNQFTGPIPDLSAAAESLFDLRLHDNRLTGPIPTSLTTLPKLHNVTLHNNKLQGPYPIFPSNVHSNVEHNNFCNSKPDPCNTQVNTLLDIAGGFGYPEKLAMSWSGNNPCQGWKSVSCDQNGKIVQLNFAKQGFVGYISPSIANITTLTHVLLNDNNLTGTIPPALMKLSQLRVLDISNNNISGDVPTFALGINLNISGNLLIVKKTMAPGEPPIQPPIERSSSGTISGGSSLNGTSTIEGSKSSPTPKWVIGVFVLIVILVIAALSFVFYACIGKKRHEKREWERYSMRGKEGSKRGPEHAVNVFEAESPIKSSGTNSGEIQVVEGGNVLVPIEVLREVTENFSESNVLGKGGFGVVYKGVLHDGTKIAVKRMEVTMDSKKGLNEFQSEIAVLSKVRHRHLVALYGICVHGNERLLVYEHMPQGTLGQWLFSYREIGASPLLWKQRVQIALDVARGVEYLHSLALQSFIHRDLKPSNVLLGDDMRAKVSDFGLVKNAPEGKYSVETRLAGTFGYLAPEYASTGRVTTKIDVFAFGVILMEMITGRRALDESLPDERSHLVAWFRKYITNKDAIKACLDPSLDPDNETFESICKVAELSGHCTVREPHQRPDMGHAVNVLSPLVEEWKPTTGQDEEDSFNIDLDMSLPQALQRWQAGEGNSLALSSGYHNSYSSSAPPGNTQ